MCPECRPEPEAPTFTPVAEVSARLYFGCALIVIVVCTGIAVPTSDVDDEYLVGQTLYGLTAAFWVLVPMFLAWPKKHSVDIPFPTLFETVRNLERRLRGVALVVTAGLVILLIHLVFYPWPATIPDIQDLHEQYKQQGHPTLRVPEPMPPPPTAP
jgi:membrane protease YdiL (CAAX protease family)